MTARTTDEPHRAPSQLELLFDLTFVVAISRITAQLASGIADGGGAHAVAPYLQVFFAIWWAWMNFTWFASAYDNDDIAFRLLTLIQMAGVLVLAAGVPAAFNHNDYLAVTVGYVIMRSGLIAHWLRAAIEDPAHRATSIRYAVGFAGSQVAWLVRLTLAEAGLLPGNSASFVFLGLSRSSSRYRCGRSARAGRAGTRTTSPTVTGCLRSSFSARAFSPRQRPSRRWSSMDESARR